jgi:hypothetical protein
MSNGALKIAWARHNRSGQLNSDPLAGSQKSDGERQASTIVVSEANIQGCPYDNMGFTVVRARAVWLR